MTTRRPSSRIKRTAHGIPVRAQDWTDQELRSAHVAYDHHGMRTVWASVGNRLYHQRGVQRRKQAA